MTYKFLSLLFFCGVCISAFSQELQSPQINQNAIFANPGLAGSKGCTRVSATISHLNSNFKRGGYYADPGVLYKQDLKQNLYSSSISMDGLICKNKLGIAGYVKGASHYMKEKVDSYYDNSTFNSNQYKFYYVNYNFGFILSPKLFLRPRKIEKKAHTLSPALAIGFIGTQLNFSGSDIIQTNDTKDSFYLHDGNKKKTFGMDYVSASLLYSSSDSYVGIKFNFEEILNSFLLHGIDIVCAKTFYNKKNLKPRFSFSPQCYISIPAYKVSNKPVEYYFVRVNRHNSNNYFVINLDFRYDKIVVGTFGGWSVNPDYYYGGISAGIQLSNAKVLINYAPIFLSQNNMANGLFISANFYLKAKK